MSSICRQFWQLIRNTWRSLKLFSLDLSHLMLDLVLRHLVTHLSYVLWRNTVFLVDGVLLTLAVVLRLWILLANVQLRVYRFRLWRFTTAGQMYIRIVKLGVHMILLFAKLLNLLLFGLNTLQLRIRLVIEVWRYLTVHQHVFLIKCILWVRIVWFHFKNSSIVCKFFKIIIFSRVLSQEDFIFLINNLN